MASSNYHLSGGFSFRSSLLIHASLFFSLWGSSGIMAADCSGTSLGTLPGTWLAPVDLRQGVCGIGPKSTINCDGQPATDCRQIATNSAKNFDLLLRKQWTGNGAPKYANCEGGVVRLPDLLYVHISWHMPILIL